MKRYSAFPKAPALLDLHYYFVLYHIQDTRWGGGLTPLQRCGQCTLQPQLMRPGVKSVFTERLWYFGESGVYGEAWVNYRTV